MFGIDFNELLLIAVIALVVLGPEKLPGAARTAGALVRRARNAWASVQAEVARELDAEGLKQHWQEGAAAVREAGNRMREAASGLHEGVQSGLQAARSEFDAARATAAGTAAGAPTDRAEPGDIAASQPGAATATLQPEATAALARVAGELHTLAAQLDTLAGSEHDALRVLAADLRGTAAQVRAWTLPDRTADAPDGSTTAATTADDAMPAAAALAQRLDAIAARLRTLTPPAGDAPP